MATNYTGYFVADPRPNSERLRSKYQTASGINDDLTPGDFMMQARPGVYKNKASADRAYRKVITGGTSGRVIFRNESYVRHYPEGMDKPSVIGSPRRSYITGLWKANITYEGTDENGKDEIFTRSFIMKTGYDSNLDYPIILAAIEDHQMAEQFLEKWESRVGYAPNDTTNIREIELFRIEGYTTPNAVDLVI